MSVQTEHEVNAPVTVELAADDFNSLLKREF